VSHNDEIKEEISPFSQRTDNCINILTCHFWESGLEGYGFPFQTYYLETLNTPKVLLSEASEIPTVFW